MSEPFIFINTYAVKTGKEADYARLCDGVIELVRDKEPRMLYFGFHQGEGSNEVATVQVHADAENMGFHMQLADEHIRDAMDQFLDVTNMRIQIYGTPTDAILDQMRALAGTGVPVAIYQPTKTTVRFTAS